MAFVCSVFGLCCSLGAVVMPSDLVTTVAAFSEDNNFDSNPDPDVDQRDLLGNRGTVIGEVVAGVFGDSLVLSGPSSENFLIRADSIESSIARTVSAGPPVMAAASTLFAITFEIEPGEEGVLALDFSYALQNLGVSSEVELAYSLTGPFGEDVSAFAGRFAVANGDADLLGSISESSSTLGSGSYTFSLGANIPLTDIQNIQSESVIVNDFSLEFIRAASVPEPSILISASFGLCFLFARRAR